MKFEDYQAEAMNLSVLRSDQERIEYGVLNIASEAGEIAGKYAKAVRDETEINRTEVLKEMGDVLWSLACLAEGLGSNLNEVAVLNLYKLKDRQQRNAIAGSGDNR